MKGLRNPSFGLIVVRDDAPAAGLGENIKRIEFADGDAGIVRVVEERELCEVCGMKFLAV